jgi:hypothetical protein
MAVHGVTRSTRDLDLLVIAAECLTADFWATVRDQGVSVSLRRGGADDPLAGVARFTVSGENPVDLIVGKSAWQAGVLARARHATIQGARVPVASRADLVLLKLYAAGSQDAWDVEQLLAGPERAEVIAQVETTFHELPPESRSMWARIRGSTAP